MLIVLCSSPLIYSYSSIVCKPSILSGLLSNMPKNIREIAINFTKEQMKIENHINHPEIDVQTVRLKYELDPTEFTSYDVIADTRLILSSHDFLSIVELAETSKDELKITFIKNGKPLICEIGDQNSGQVRMVMTTMREDLLKASRKPPGATSYKELMGSYISVRQNSETPEKSRHISDTEMHRAMSPGVESFQPSSKISQSLFRTNQSSVPKRKSTEMTDENRDNSISSQSQNDEPPKKMRVGGNLTQADEDAISQMIDEADLEEQMEEPMVEDVEVETNEGDIGPSPPQENSNCGFMKGLNNLRVKSKLGTTVVQSESSEYNEDSEYNDRFDVSKANFPTPSNGSIPPVNIRQANHQRNELPFEQAKANQFKKKLFIACLKPSSSKLYKGATLCEKSDESDEAEK